MGELAARRRARDLWVSRSHLVAAGAGTIALSIVAFGLGYASGRGDAPQRTPPVVLAAADQGALLELLARVEANTSAEGAVDELTFPDALKGAPGGGDAVPAQGPAAPPAAVRVPVADAVPPDADTPPAGSYTVTVLRTGDLAAAKAERERLRAAGFAAWTGAEIVDGRPAWRVAIGGYATDAAAQAALPAVVAAAGSGTVELR